MREAAAINVQWMRIPDGYENGAVKIVFYSLFCQSFLIRPLAMHISSFCDEANAANQ